MPQNCHTHVGHLLMATFDFLNKGKIIRFNLNSHSTKQYTSLVYKVIQKVSHQVSAITAWSNIDASSFFWLAHSAVNLQQSDT